MDKTVVVVVERLRKHPRYKKYIRQRIKLYAHDKDNICKESDRVVIVPTRPLSKLKRWRVVRKIET
ncbi:MAG TPA: 30S ribosomal protein S17 [bacterium (Candidatus Stahlbacteria)]|nr:30S ribosomal protein S17 [Candidatus Stahlbacteria bacterium]